MNSSLLISNANIINPYQILKGDIIIQDGIIKSIEPSGTIFPDNNWQSIDASGLMVLPGAIDPHVHLALPTPAGASADDFLTGSQAALSGGVTHLIDFVTPQRNQPLTEALKLRISEAKDCKTGISLHVGISGWLPDMEQQMEQCVKDYGVVSFKVYLAYKKSIGIDYETLERIMMIAAKLKVLVLVHAEEGETIDLRNEEFLKQGKTSPLYHSLSRTPDTEFKAVRKVIQLIEKTGCKTYFVHISTCEAANNIAEAKKRGLPVFAETCPHYLLIDDSVYNGDFNAVAPFIYSPPSRSKDNIERLWEHVSAGTFDTIATDHCPFNMKQKEAGKTDFTRIPNGAGSVEFRLPLMFMHGVLKNRISPESWVQLISTNAAAIFSLDGKGEIKPGNIADLLIFNPDTQWMVNASKQHQNCDSNIYEGMPLQGYVETTIHNGIVQYSWK